jgi:hypothetical protein
LEVTPKTFIEKRLAEGSRDLEAGRATGPFKNAKEAFGYLGIFLIKNVMSFNLLFGKNKNARN